MKRIDDFITVLVMTVFVFVTMMFATPSISIAQSGASTGKSKPSKVERTEDKIRDYHSRLKITPAQEEQWNKVARVMRENAATMERLIQEREAKMDTLNAVEDLKAYSRIADAHAEGLRSFIAAFEPLYNTMSPEQKKNADIVFTEHGQKKGQKKK